MKTLFTFFTILLFSSLLTAQNVDPCGSAFTFKWDRFNLDRYHINSVMTENNNNIIDIGGIGYEYKLNNRWTIEGGLDVGIKNTTEEDTPQLKDEWSYTRFGIAAGPTWYPHGYDTDKVRFSVGAMLNFASYSWDREQTANNQTTKSEYSASTIGACVHAGVDFEILDDVRVGARYELEFESMPKSSQKFTSNNQTTETDGPGMTFFGTGFGGVFLKVIF